MASLVADYGTSSGDSWSDSDTGDTNNQNPVIHAREEDGVNLLTNVNSSSSDADDDGDTTELFTRTEEPPKLPLPDIFIGSSTTSLQGSSSVFANPFKDKEDAKASILEQHVKMSTVVEKNEAKNKKTCYKFLKGKCRFGDKCKFSHGSKPPPNAPNVGVRHAVQVHGTQDFNTNEEEVDEDTQTLKRKHKSGIGNTLVPPKKAMKAYQKQQIVEKPWMKER
ncbi:uncharacterized protein LOC100367008 [Saccoglossus kowalevskii]|uniref:Uncharacterized protein LOC100367008 n=1 Tax=Saccoglossus kowalevskii TaxID=10224 RepID=A0ABM0GND3_SACKO|nr:PREDICTED: uncharacterized protein LOC100367008 [Saccoglossus kowalevskii]